jgi:hypothetical protein
MRKIYVDHAIPVLRAGVLDEACRSLYRRNSALHWQYELFKLRKQMRCPSIGRVNDCSRPHDTSVRVDDDPAVAVTLRNAGHGSVGLQVQVTLLQNNAQEGVNELVSVSAICSAVANENISHELPTLAQKGALPQRGYLSSE